MWALRGYEGNAGHAGHFTGSRCLVFGWAIVIFLFFAAPNSPDWGMLGYSPEKGGSIFHSCSCGMEAETAHGSHSSFCGAGHKVGMEISLLCLGAKLQNVSHRHGSALESSPAMFFMVLYEGVLTPSGTKTFKIHHHLAR